MQLRRPVPWRTVDVMNSQLAAGLVGLSLVRADGTFSRHAARVAGGARMALPFIPSLQIAMSSARAEEGAWPAASSTPATRWATTRPPQ
jgi:hypothetical protein